MRGEQHRRAARRGDLFDTAGSAPGRVLLANRRSWREMLITRLELDEQQRAGLDEVRRRGYACAEGQIAVPVSWREAGVLGAPAIHRGRGRAGGRDRRAGAVDGDLLRPTAEDAGARMIDDRHTQQALLRVRSPALAGVADASIVP